LVGCTTGKSPGFLHGRRGFPYFATIASVYHGSALSMLGSSEEPQEDEAGRTELSPTMAAICAPTRVGTH
jgi:hypothetical protein